VGVNAVTKQGSQQLYNTIPWKSKELLITNYVIIVIRRVLLAFCNSKGREYMMTTLRSEN
jgi:hypothetical protein